MNKLKTWQFRIFYLLLFLLPTNLAKHFPLPSSYVSGILVDYLIPTLYLTDILIISLLVLWLIDKFSSHQQLTLWPSRQLLKSPLIIFLLLLLPSVIFSTSLIPAAYKWLKFLELTLLVSWIKDNLDLKTHLTTITNWLSASVICQSLLALAQWLKQSSLFGYWFFGEQPYTSATPGIDKITWFSGALKIPPLGTLPHPNVLAGFLVASLPLILYQLIKARQPKSIFLYFTSILLATLTLFLTFSLSAWLALLLITLPAIILTQTSSSLLSSRHQQLSLVKNLPRFDHWQKIISTHENPQTGIQLHDRGLRSPPVKLALIYLLSLIIILSLATKLSFLAPESSFTRRSQLANIAKDIFKYRPLTGVGLNSFTPVMEQYGYVTATTRFLQPVHNIYLLVLAETGLLGLLGFLYLTISAIIKAFKNHRFNLLIPFLSLLFIGLFDHYPLTIHQTSLLFFLLLAFL